MRLGIFEQEFVILFEGGETENAHFAHGPMRRPNDLDGVGLNSLPLVLKCGSLVRQEDIHFGMPAVSQPGRIEMIVVDEPIAQLLGANEGLQRQVVYAEIFDRPQAHVQTIGQVCQQSIGFESAEPKCLGQMVEVGRQVEKHILFWDLRLVIVDADDVDALAFEQLETLVIHVGNEGTGFVHAQAQEQRRLKTFGALEHAIECIAAPHGGIVHDETDLDLVLAFEILDGQRKDLIYHRRVFGSLEENAHANQLIVGQTTHEGDGE